MIFTILIGIGIFTIGMACGVFLIALCQMSGNSSDQELEDREQIEYLAKFKRK